MARKGGTRSPRYPSIGLEDAVKKVQMLYNADQTAGSPVDTAVKHMGFKSRSGPASTAIAALKRFGLIESRGGRIVPTKRAVSILLLPSEDKRRSEALQDACMEPTLYRELFDRFKETGFPSEDTLAHDLVQEQGFNPNSVRGFIRDWRESLAFSGLTDEDGGIRITKYASEGFLNEDPAADPWDVDQKRLQTARQERERESKEGQGRRRPMADGTKEDIYTLSSGDAVLQWPDRITQAEFEELGDWLDLMRRKLKRSVVSESPEEESEPDA